jgi:hypothetical protein
MPDPPFLALCFISYLGRFELTYRTERRERGPALDNRTDLQVDRLQGAECSPDQGPRSPRGRAHRTTRAAAVPVDIADVIRALAAAGAATVPGILGDEVRRRLLEEARTFPFIAAPAVVKPYGVQQRYAAVTAFPPGSGFRVLQEAFQALLEDQLARLPAYPFATPLRFNGSALHRYPPGRLGISPHRDSARSVNLIAVFVQGAVLRLPGPRRSECRGSAECAR